MKEPTWMKWGRRLLTVLAVLIIVAPGFWVMYAAFRPNVEIMAKPPVWISRELSLQAFENIFSGSPGQGGVPVIRYFFNSLIIAGVSTVLAMLLGMAAGYAFSRYQFRSKGALFLGLMLCRAVPGVALSLPLFILYARTGLIDTHAGMILIYLAMNLPFSIWLMDGFFNQIPVELRQAAEIDGASPWQAFWRIEFPLALPGIASAAIFAFLTAWNEFALASQLTRSVNSKTLPVGLLDFSSEFTMDWTGMSALAVIIIIPALLMTFVIQRHLVAGLVAGGVKG